MSAFFASPAAVAKAKAVKAAVVAAGFAAATPGWGFADPAAVTKAQFAQAA